MSWTEERSRERIRRFQNNVPETDIQVEEFERDYMPRRREALAKAMMLTEASAAAIVDIPRNRAILTDGVHVYVELMDFSTQLSSERETEAAYRRALTFLHLYYGGSDRLIEAFGLQRVDFHGARLHAVVLTPTGDDNALERIGRAVAFARAIMAMVNRMGGRFNGRYETRVAIGIDAGRAVAINSGRGDEHEPLFIGRPANHAAHLAACGVPGIHLSKRVRQALAPLSFTLHQGLDPFEDLVRRSASARAGGGFRTLQEAADDEIAKYDVEMAAAESQGSLPVFNFHQHTPPLKTLDFKLLAPSRSVLMAMAALFADLDGFTDYVDVSLASGRVSQAVANLHVMRGEFAATVREDFDGRKVRFIGDCLKAVVAEGDASAVDPVKTVDTAFLLAGALRSSFLLCKAELPGIEDLGLAIGVDYGTTPACRIGLRGASGVRCVTSAATCESERLQRTCDGRETIFGEAAFDAAGLAVRQALRGSRTVSNLTYANAVRLVKGVAPARVGSTTGAVVQAHSR